MNHSTIADIALATDKDTANLLADIKGIFGDDFPQVHSWNANTKLPDETVTYKILELSVDHKLFSKGRSLTNSSGKASII